jgi:hypothetical protein
MNWKPFVVGLLSGIVLSAVAAVLFLVPAVGKIKSERDSLVAAAAAQEKNTDRLDLIARAAVAGRSLDIDSDLGAWQWSQWSIEKKASSALDVAMAKVKIQQSALTTCNVSFEVMTAARERELQQKAAVVGQHPDNRELLAGLLDLIRPGLGRLVPGNHP